MINFYKERPSNKQVYCETKVLKLKIDLVTAVSSFIFQNKKVRNLCSFGKSFDKEYKNSDSSKKV